ncbi:MAG: adenylyltransferase/cytidyltransferase family protein [Chlamydiia bacterium]|nr:adenylyltransferase/cytidyltransferase family protein [Chlamydiia bacterium]
MTPFQNYRNQKVIDPKILPETISEWRSNGHTIATLNGSFDLMHAGHLHMIYEASLTADKLLIALNTDASVQKYKSKDRPIIPLQYRLDMMAAIAFIDAVTWFDETDPCAILNTIRPDVHVNGAEYGENCIEADVVKKGGGRIHIVELIPGLSTSEIIKKIESLSCASSAS